MFTQTVDEGDETEARYEHDVDDSLFSSFNTVALLCYAGAFVGRREPMLKLGLLVFGTLSLVIAQYDSAEDAPVRVSRHVRVSASGPSVFSPEPRVRARSNSADSKPAMESNILAGGMRRHSH